jgi:heat shock protein HslJ
MTDSGNAVSLTLVPRVRSAMNPADLVGTRWRLRSVNDTMQSGDSAITLQLTARTMSGFAGCRAYTGTYQAEGDKIGFPSISMTETECNKGEAALLREERFTTDLSEAAHYRLGATELEIATAPGRKLVFVAQ